jgi:NAD kinase
MQYLCPCIFKATEKGRLKENVDRRRYIVFETDERPGDWDGQAGLIDRLAQELPLRMVLWSGNKSLHAWFDGSTPLKDKIQKFHDLVITLGGDRAVLREAQMVRFPWGTNSKTNNPQKVIYYSHARR